MRLIVGLGNVGVEYANTRHNVGFMVVDELARRHDGRWSTETKLQAQVARIRLDGEDVLLAKPLTMMNLSGEAIQAITRFYKLNSAQTIVIFDDVDVALGTVKVRLGGGDSGHQGVRSTLRHTGESFIRVRVGIDPNDRNREPSEVYVLKPFSTAQAERLPAAIELACQVTLASLREPQPITQSID